jgi:hypothetical protein
MTASFSHAWPRFDALLLALLLLASLAGVARAEGLIARGGEIVAVEEGLRVSADFDMTLGPRLEAALNRGVVLHFLVDFDLIRPRSWWFDEDILGAQLTLKLSYNALTRQYLLVTGNDYQNFTSLAEARLGLGSLRDWLIPERNLLKKHTTYKAAIRMKLDVSQLPKPLQVSALGSREWGLTSEWHSWTYTHQGRELTPGKEPAR